MRVLVTGGAGFVGASAALWLKAAHPDWQVAALDNLRRRGSELALTRLTAGGVRFLHGDVRLREDLAEARPVDWLIECSAEPSVHAGYGGSPDYVVGSNLNGAINCLEHLRRHGGALIFISSSRVYPIAALRALPLETAGERVRVKPGVAGAGWSAAGISEAFPIEGPRSLYGATKLAAELMIEEYAALYGLRAVVNRCGVICGPWQMGKVDQGFVSLWLARHVFGGGLAYIGYDGAGTQVRDVLHVADLCRLVDVQITGGERYASKTYNVGGGPEISVSLRELTGHCQALTGTAIEIGKVPQISAADVPYYVTDPRGSGRKPAGSRSIRSRRRWLTFTNGWWTIARHWRRSSQRGAETWRWPSSQARRG
jgi:CDP-paratose 2-epimerase